MRKRIIVLAGIGIVLGCGVVHGLWTNRWSVAAEAAVERLAKVPSRIGDWEGEDAALDARVWEEVGGTGYLQRRYVNRRTGSVMWVCLVCGRPGPVSIHTPDICYPRSGFQVVNDTSRRTIEVGEPAEAAEFNHIEVRLESATTGLIRQEVLWGWSPQGKWQAPRSPRLAFARYPVLYKLYVFHPLPGDKEPAGNDATEFLRVLLPEIQKCVFDNP
jgi:hypothetical protein